MADQGFDHAHAVQQSSEPAAASAPIQMLAARAEVQQQQSAEVVQRLGGRFGRIMGGIGQAAQVAGGVAGMIPGGEEALAGLQERAGGIVGGAAEALGGLAESVGGAATAAGGQAANLGSGGGGGGSGGGGVGGMIGSIGGAVGGMIGGRAGNIIGGLSGVAGGVTSGLMGGGGAMGAIGGAMGGLGGMMGGMGGAAGGVGRAMGGLGGMLQRSPDPASDVQLDADPGADVQLDAVQRAGGGDSEAVHRAAAHGIQGSGGTLPHLGAIQQSFGRHDVSAVQAHVGGRAAEASAAMGANAYATGNAVAFKAAPDLHTAAHEAAHVVQQRGGVSLKGGVGQVGDRYEQHADAVADLVVQGKSAEELLDSYAGGASGESTVQRTIDPISAAELGVAVFGLVSQAVPTGSEGLQWTRNIGQAIHNWPQDQQPSADEMVTDHKKSILSVDCTGGYSSAWAHFELVWNYNGADIDQARVEKRASNSWAGGTFGSVLNVRFEMQEASRSHESGGVAAMICYVSGTLDPTGEGDVEFAGRVLLKADGTAAPMERLQATRGSWRGLGAPSNLGAGWSISNRTNQGVGLHERDDPAPSARRPE